MPLTPQVYVCLMSALLLCIQQRLFYFSEKVKQQQEFYRMGRGVHVHTTVCIIYYITASYLTLVYEKETTGCLGTLLYIYIITNKYI